MQMLDNDELPAVDDPVDHLIMFRRYAWWNRAMAANGQPIPTYDNEDARQMAKIFTGLFYGGAGVTKCSNVL